LKRFSADASHGVLSEFFEEEESNTMRFLRVEGGAELQHLTPTEVPSLGHQQLHQVHQD